MEHYEIARYGLLKTWATKLGLSDAAELLGETLEEEKNADALLTKAANQGKSNRTQTETATTTKAKAA